jgi:hypothetical protein
VRRGSRLGERGVSVTETLRAVEVTGLNRWRWVLADHQVNLDVGTADYQAFCDLSGYLDRHRLPHDPVGSEAETVERVSAWISKDVFGSALSARLSGTVWVIVPAMRSFCWRLELAKINGVPLARKKVSLVYAHASWARPKIRKMRPAACTWTANCWQTFRLDLARLRNSRRAEYE